MRKPNLAPVDEGETGGGTRPYLDQSVEFRRFLQNKKADAMRSRDELAGRAETLEAEIRSIMQEIGEADDIILRCEAALTLEQKPRQPPQITERPQ